MDSTNLLSKFQRALDACDTGLEQTKTPVLIEHSRPRVTFDPIPTVVEPPTAEQQPMKKWQIGLIVIVSAIVLVAGFYLRTRVFKKLFNKPQEREEDTRPIRPTIPNFAKKRVRFAPQKDDVEALPKKSKKQNMDNIDPNFLPI
jgi:hypothetical protein